MHLIYSLDISGKEEQGPKRLSDVPQVIQFSRGTVRAGECFLAPHTVLSVCPLCCLTHVLMKESSPSVLL